MKFSILELHSLTWLCDDYENVSTIINDIRRDTHAPVTEDDIGQCLMELARTGNADAFEFDVEGGEYVRLNDVQGDWRGKWFFITPQGRAELEANWVEA